MIKAINVKGRDEGLLQNSLGDVCLIVLISSAWIVVSVSSSP